LALGVCFGLGYLAYRLVIAETGAGINFDVYRAAAAAVSTGEPLYGVSHVGRPGYTYRYPPVWLVWFAGYLLVDPLVGYLAHLVTVVAAGAVLGGLLSRVIEAHGGDLTPIDRLLVAGFVVLGPFAAPSLLYGNVNHLLALGVGAGLVWLARDREAAAGAAVGLAALLKVFPAGLGVWFLHRREWRALGVAIATGLAGLGLGAVLYGVEATRDFFALALGGRVGPDAFTGGLPPSSEYVTLLRPLSAVVPAADRWLLTVLALGLLGPVVAFLYRREEGPVAGMCAAFVTLAAILLVLPSFSLYFLVLAYPMVPLLYLLPARVGSVFAGGATVALVTLKLPDVATVLAFAPSAVAEPALAAASGLYTVATPVLVGTLLMVAACVSFVRADG
jgi:hypothetical protein